MLNRDCRRLGSKYVSNRPNNKYKDATKTFDYITITDELMTVSCLCIIQYFFRDVKGCDFFSVRLVSEDAICGLRDPKWTSIYQKINMLFCFDYIRNVSDILIRSAWKTLIFSTVALNCSLLGLVNDSRKYVDVFLL